MPSSELLTVRGLSAHWGPAPVLQDVSFAVAAGEYLVLMGPNGSGKTTLLRAIAGFEAPSSGEIRYRGRSIDRTPPHRRGIGFLFQDPALFTDRTVGENIAYGLEVAGWDANAIAQRVAEVSWVVGVGSLGGRDPESLSGGERQRVALARALAPGPSLVLLDEPFGSLDADVQRALRLEFRRTLSKMGVAAIHVTHDREEGLFLGDRVALLFGGRLAAVGTPKDVFAHPGSADVARFLGYNVLPQDGAHVAVHPADVQITDATTGRTDATLVSTGVVGRERVSYVEREGEFTAEVREPVDTAPRSPGSRVGLRWTEGRSI